MHRKDKRTNLEQEIDTVLSRMREVGVKSDEYPQLLEYLERLTLAKSKLPSKKVSPDTIAVVIGNLVGIGFILGYEKIGAITSKALGFVIRGRV